MFSVLMSSNNLPQNIAGLSDKVDELFGKRVPLSHYLVAHRESNNPIKQGSGYFNILGTSAVEPPLYLNGLNGSSFASLAYKQEGVGYTNLIQGSCLPSTEIGNVHGTIPHGNSVELGYGNCCLSPSASTCSSPSSIQQVSDLASFSTNPFSSHIGHNSDEFGNGSGISCVCSNSSPPLKTENDFSCSSNSPNACLDYLNHGHPIPQTSSNCGAGHPMFTNSSGMVRSVGNSGLRATGLSLSGAFLRTAGSISSTQGSKSQFGDFSPSLSSGQSSFERNPFELVVSSSYGAPSPTHKTLENQKYATCCDAIVKEDEPMRNQSLPAACVSLAHSHVHEPAAELSWDRRPYEMCGNVSYQYNMNQMSTMQSQDALALGIPIYRPFLSPNCCLGEADALGSYSPFPNERIFSAGNIGGQSGVLVPFGIAQNLIGAQSCHSMSSGSMLAYSTNGSQEAMLGPVDPTASLPRSNTNRVLQCPICKKTFKRPYNLKVHMRIHTGRTLFQCVWPACGKTFTQKSHLRVHERLHTGVMLLACSWPGCNKRFTRRLDLDKHLRIHTGVKPYVCVICRWAFTQSNNAYSHVMNRHKKEKAKYPGNAKWYKMLVDKF